MNHSLLKATCAWLRKTSCQYILELMEVTSALYAGALITLLLVLVRLYFTTAVHEVYIWIMWLADVKHLRTLPSPSKAKRWIVGHALEVILLTI